MVYIPLSSLHWNRATQCGNIALTHMHIHLCSMSAMYEEVWPLWCLLTLGVSASFYMSIGTYMHVCILTVMHTSTHTHVSTEIIVYATQSHIILFRSCVALVLSTSPYTSCCHSRGHRLGCHCYILWVTQTSDVLAITALLQSCFRMLQSLALITWN